MSAAEPVDENRGIMNTAGDAAVINITRGARTTPKGRWERVDTPRPGAPGPDSLAEMAEHYELTFNEHHLTLTDDDTAAVYTITMNLARQIIAGALARGIVDKQQQARLDALLEGVLAAPRLVQ